MIYIRVKARFSNWIFVLIADLIDESLVCWNHEKWINIESKARFRNIDLNYNNTSNMNAAWIVYFEPKFWLFWII